MKWSCAASLAAIVASPSVAFNLSAPKFLVLGALEVDQQTRSAAGRFQTAAEPANRISALLRVNKVDEVTSTPLSGSPTPESVATLISEHKRKKRNKYTAFSKVDNRALDPYDELMSESESRIAILEQEKREKENLHKRSRQLRTFGQNLDHLHDERTPTSHEQPSLAFPNNKDIDPYDPTTFGYVEIGTVKGSHGVHGWLKVISESDFADARLCVTSDTLRHIKAPNKRAPRPIILRQGKRRQGQEYLVLLDGADDREAADRFRGCTLYARQEDDIPERKQDEFLVTDLVGLKVFLLPDKQVLSDHAEICLSTRKLVGEVAGIVLGDEMSSIPGLAHDMLEVSVSREFAGHSDTLVLIPFVPQIVPIVDIEKRELVIDPPPGLLALTYVRQERFHIKGLLAPA
jgi:16S rRNA processing protein RimM